MKEYLYYKLRAGNYGGVDVLGYFEQATGVLAGQTLKQFLDNFPNEEAAKKAYPEAEGYSSVWTDPQVNLNHLPDENDPVVGGMYLDDLAEFESEDGYYKK